MCGRYCRKSDEQQIAEAFHVNGPSIDSLILVPNDDIRPTSHSKSSALISTRHRPPTVEEATTEEAAVAVWRKASGMRCKEYPSKCDVQSDVHRYKLIQITNTCFRPRAA